MLLLRRQVIAIAAPCEYFEVAGVRMLASACKTLASRLHKSGSSSIQDTNLDNESKGGGSHAGELAARLRSAHRRAVGRGPLCGRGVRKSIRGSRRCIVFRSVSDGLRELQLLAPPRPALRLQTKVRRMLVAADIGRVRDGLGDLKFRLALVPR